MLREIMALQEQLFHQNRFPDFGSTFRGTIDGEYVKGKVVAIEHVGWNSFAIIEKDDGTWVNYKGKQTG